LTAREGTVAENAITGKAASPRPETGERAQVLPRRSLPGRLLREPLLHFVLVAFVLFIGYRMLHPATEADQRSNRIELTTDDFVQMSVAWLAQGRPPPSPEQLQNLIEVQVREEVLYREALVLGLDRDDTIVKRRLAQKMEFLADQIASTIDPTTDELKSWFANNEQLFALSPRITFRHLYFSPDQRGEHAREAATEAATTLIGKSGDWPEGPALADPFMFQDRYVDRSFDEMAKLFGLDFARALLGLKPGSWQGPIESGYGWHLVFVEASSLARVPAFEEIESDVKSEWLAEQRAQARRKSYEAMRARYQVILPEAAADEPKAANPAVGSP
jgi:peptidyl-prolyl cis-trans isomerase C